MQGTLSLHSIYELEKSFKEGGVLLDVDCKSIKDVNTLFLDHISQKFPDVSSSVIEDLRSQLSADHHHTTSKVKP